MSASQDGIPFSFIFFQALNFCIFASILAYLIRKKSPKALEKKYQEYMSMNEQAENLYKEAMSEKRKIQDQLQQMKSRFSTFQLQLNQEVKK